MCRIFVQDLARAPDDLEPTLVLELHIAKLESTLVGATPEQRFASFIESLSQPARRRLLFEEYPVLARLIVQQTTRCVRSTLEFLERLARDVDELQTTLNAGVALGTLVSASGDLADPRDGGRSVTAPLADLLIFACPQEHRLGLAHDDSHFTQLEQLDARPRDCRGPVPAERCRASCRG